MPVEELDTGKGCHYHAGALALIGFLAQIRVYTLAPLPM